MHICIYAWYSCPLCVQDDLTPLHCAARSGHESLLTLLLAHGAAVGAKTRNGLTALHMAAQGDHAPCALVLLQHRANIEDVTMVGSLLLDPRSRGGVLRGGVDDHFPFIIAILYCSD